MFSSIVFVTFKSFQMTLSEIESLNLFPTLEKTILVFTIKDQFFYKKPSMY